MLQGRAEALDAQAHRPCAMALQANSVQNADTERAMIRLAQLREKVWGCGFPPLPMMVIGEDGEERVASSFAFLMAVFQNTPPGWYSGQDARQFGARQVGAAIEMHEGIAAVGLVHGDTLPVSAQEQIYDVACHAFRKYVSVVTSSSPDLRFVPYEDIDKTHRVVGECRQWMLETAGIRVDANCSYKQVLKIFADCALQESGEVLNNLRQMYESLLNVPVGV